MPKIFEAFESIAPTSGDIDLDDIDSELKWLEQTKVFKCGSCPKTFKRKDYYYEHQWVHTAHKPFKCKVCDNCFAYKANLYHHMKIHTRQNLFKCDVCGKEFTQKKVLFYHLKSLPR